MRLTVLGPKVSSIMTSKPASGSPAICCGSSGTTGTAIPAPALFWSQDLADDPYGLEEDCTYPNLKAFSQAVANSPPTSSATPIRSRIMANATVIDEHANP